jgi:hypothetical protein
VGKLLLEVSCYCQSLAASLFCLCLFGGRPCGHAVSKWRITTGITNPSRPAQKKPDDCPADCSHPTQPSLPREMYLSPFPIQRVNCRGLAWSKTIA